MLSVSLPTHTDLHAERLEALLRTSKVLATDIHLERLLVAIAGQVTEVLDAERSSVFLYEADRDELRGMVVQGMAPEELCFPADRGLAGYVARTRRTLNIADAQEDPRFDARHDLRSGFRTRSVLCTPILSPDRELMGVIQVLNRRSGAAFSDEDAVLLEAFSAHASVAIERARLVERFAEQQRLEASLRVAHEIQMSMLPRAFPAPGAAERYDLYAHLQPAQTVGGDLYDFFRIDEHRLGFAVGDVSGKGVPAALFMNGTYTLLRLAATEGLPPDRCFENINRVQQNRKAMFVTLFYGILDLHTGRVTYGNAGHPPPCIVRRDGTVRFADRARNLPLCLLRSPRFQVQHLLLEPGDLLVLYTDGVLEATNPAGEHFGAERLLLTLRDAASRTADESVDRLVEVVHAFTEDTPQRDDLTVLALRYGGPGAGDRRPGAAL